MTTLATTVSAYLAIGAGFFAGLLGVGGGLIMVPALVILFEGIGLPRAFVFQIALGQLQFQYFFQLQAKHSVHQYLSLLFPWL